MTVKRRLLRRGALVGVSIVTLASILGYTQWRQARADYILSFSLLGTHPEASAQPTLTGRAIAKLVAYEGKLYAGYGDYTDNTGPIAINPLDLTTKTFDGSQLSSPTEAIWRWRILGDKLYAPLTDPRGGQAGGYSVSGPWTNRQVISPTAHTFDIATLTGTDLWVVGSGPLGGSSAMAWRTTDGTTWNVVQSDTKSSGQLTGFERYYWVAAMNNKIYMQAHDVPGAPVRIFDGSTWTTGTTEQIAIVDDAPVVFNNKIITKKNGLSAYDGTTLTRASNFVGLAKDFYVDGPYLYVLRSNATVARTTDLSTWEEFGNAPSESTAIAVANNRLYLGNTSSELYESSVMAEPPTINLSAPISNSTVYGTTTLSATVSGGADIRRVEFMVNDMVVASDSSAPYSLTWDSRSRTDGTVTMRARVFYTSLDNYRDSTPVTFTINNTGDIDGDGIKNGDESSTPSRKALVTSQPAPYSSIAQTPAEAILRTCENCAERSSTPAQKDSTPSANKQHIRYWQWIGISLFLVAGMGVVISTLLRRPTK